MDIQKYLKGNDFVTNEQGNYIYTYKHDSVNIYHLMNDVKEDMKSDILDFLNANPKATTNQITEYLNSL